MAPELLYAIARTESNLNPKAVQPRTCATHRQLRHRTDADQQPGDSPKLALPGIREADLYDPCINPQVGAWLMADSTRHGITWNAVGAYNAACSQLKGEACTKARATYAWKVYRHLPKGTSEPHAAGRLADRHHGSVAAPRPAS